MTQEERKKICKIIAKVCMWGHVGIGSNLIEELDKSFKDKKSWRNIYDENSRQAKMESVGVIKDEQELLSWLRRGYWLCNYEPGRLDLFNPRPMNGLCKYVVGELADRYGKIHDRWNYDVYHKRAAGQS